MESMPKIKRELLKINYMPALFYVLGALLGEGCIYYWRKNESHLINLSGDENFTQKYAEKISKCFNWKIKKHINRNQNLWFVNFYNQELYYLFKDIRKDLNILLNLLKEGNYKKNCLQFVEGFFDAEGCVKVIKEKVRKTPKICLDICNTTYWILELIKNILKDELGIEARYSIQKANCVKNKQIAYHLRIYKKEFIRIFFENINTIKLKDKKINYVNNWLNNGKGS